MGLTESVKVMTEMMENLPKSRYATHGSDDTQDLNVSEADTHDMEEFPIFPQMKPRPIGH